MVFTQKLWSETKIEISNVQVLEAAGRRCVSSYPHKDADANARMLIEDDVNGSITAAVGVELEREPSRWKCRSFSG